MVPKLIIYYHFQILLLTSLINQLIYDQQNPYVLSLLGHKNNYLLNLLTLISANTIWIMNFQPNYQ